MPYPSVEMMVASELGLPTEAKPLSPVISLPVRTWSTVRAGYRMFRSTGTGVPRISYLHYLYMYVSAVLKIPAD